MVKDQVVEDPESAQKIAQLQGELEKSHQLLNDKNNRIEELLNNGCSLISVMLYNKITVYSWSREIFEYSDEYTYPPPGSCAGSSSGHEQADPDAVYPHPLNADIMVTADLLRWPLRFLPYGSLFGQTPRPEEMLASAFAPSAISDV